MRALFLFTIILLFSIQNLWAYCELDGTNHAPLPISSWKAWSAVPDSLVLQSINTQATGVLNYNDLKVVVWNLEKGENDGLYHDLNNISRNADLVLMQEAYLDRNFENLACMRADLDWRMASSFWDYHDMMTGVATASRQTPLSVRFIRSPDRETLIDTPKMIMVDEYKIPNRSETLLVVNIHGINFVGDRPFERQVNLAVVEIAKHKGPVIFAGDFNARNKDRTLYLEKVLSPFGLAHANVNYQDHNEWGFLPFDHLYQRGFDVLSSKQDMTINSSDHKPLYFELKLR